MKTVKNKPDRLLYGAAYYDEYMPYERLSLDMEMMKKARINVIRIAESTWSTEEPEEGVFDFSHVTRVLNACEKNGISVIVGTPTYAIPAWMARKHPEIMVTDASGRRPYGARQIMDITHPAYLFYCERIIRQLMEAVQGYDCVIGYQIDNETKHYGTSSKNVQQMFVRWMKKRFDGDLERMNWACGLDYWSNRINSWEDFPSMQGTINGSLGSLFEQFRRQLVTDFLLWQSKIVREYCRDDQFITHNFDFAWKGHSYGVQPDVDHFRAAEAVSLTGCDIYHPFAKHFTGKEIAFCGDLARGLKKDNYLVIETEAQGFPDWTPLPGQTRQQAFSHLAGGADGVMYWHWHSLHNACETYWKGVLSHDLKENAVYREVCRVGERFETLNDRLINLKKKNRVALMVSNESLTAMNWFPLPGGRTDYNDVVRRFYDALYELNVECDVISPQELELSGYDLLVVPALYSAPKETLERLSAWARQGGTLLASFKTGFTDENVKVWADTQPYLLCKDFGIHYQQFCGPEALTLCAARKEGTAAETAPETGKTAEDEKAGSGLQGRLWPDVLFQNLNAEECQAGVFQELLISDGAEFLAGYAEPGRAGYGAISRRASGEGMCYYVGCLISAAMMKNLLTGILKEKGLWTWRQEETFPVVIREGRNEKGERIRYYFNYSEKPECVKNREEAVILEGDEGTEAGSQLRKDQILQLAPWGVCITASEDEEK